MAGRGEAGGRGSLGDWARRRVSAAATMSPASPGDTARQCANLQSGPAWPHALPYPESAGWSLLEEISPDQRLGQLAQGAEGEGQGPRTARQQRLDPKRRPDHAKGVCGTLSSAAASASDPSLPLACRRRLPPTPGPGPQAPDRPQHTPQQQQGTGRSPGACGRGGERWQWWGRTHTCWRPDGE